MTSWLGLTARLVLALLLVALPSTVVLIPADSLMMSGVTDGADGSGGGDDGSRAVHVPVAPPSTTTLETRPVMASAQFRLPGRDAPFGLPHRPGSPRSPPQR